MTKRKIFKHIYQFKIILAGILPPVWRRIQVPETYNFWDLHVAIQDAMGWQDCHLHAFKLLHPVNGMLVEITMPSDDFQEHGNIRFEYQEKIADWLTLQNNQATYIYDFGDRWTHELQLEKILPRNPETKYPVCIEGKRACPPEDSGGPPGYTRLLEAMKDTSHPDHEELMEWVGEDFEPEYFDPQKVVFHNPDTRLKKMLEHLYG